MGTNRPQKSQFDNLLTTALLRLQVSLRAGRGLMMQKPWGLEGRVDDGEGFLGLWDNNLAQIVLQQVRKLLPRMGAWNGRREECILKTFSALWVTEKSKEKNKWGGCLLLNLPPSPAPSLHACPRLQEIEFSVPSSCIEPIFVVYLEYLNTSEIPQTDVIKFAFKISVGGGNCPCCLHCAGPWIPS